MREMMFSVVRLSGALTMFSMEQMQNAVLAPSDTRKAIVRLCRTLDAMSDSLASKLDSPKRAALESMTKAQIDMLNRTSGVVQIDMDTAADFMKRTSDSVSGMMHGAVNGKAA